MTKDSILKQVEECVSTEENIGVLRVKLYELNFAYNMLLEIENKGKHNE